MAPLRSACRTLGLMLLLQAVAGPAVAGPALAKPRPRGAAAEDVSLARSYVLASCLMARYPDTPIAREADAWAAGLVEDGRISGALYKDLAEIGRTRAPAPLTSTAGVPLRFASCLKLYDDPALPALIRRVLARD